MTKVRAGIVVFSLLLGWMGTAAVAEDERRECEETSFERFSIANVPIIGDFECPSDGLRGEAIEACSEAVRVMAVTCREECAKFKIKGADRKCSLIKAPRFSEEAVVTCSGTGIGGDVGGTNKMIEIGCAIPMICSCGRGSEVD